MIALCRAVNIPARFTTGIDYGADPALGPTDFHAYVEAYLGDRWYIFDPSGTAIPMGFVRFGTGRDAADVAFATIFGSVASAVPRITIEAVAGADGQVAMPYHCAEALSTDVDPAGPLTRGEPDAGHVDATPDVAGLCRRHSRFDDSRPATSRGVALRRQSWVFARGSGALANGRCRFSSWGFSRFAIHRCHFNAHEPSERHTPTCATLRPECSLRRDALD
jgi:hypothetical protein